MSETTTRHNLPLIQPGQAQKELAHNEALAALDLLAQPAAIAAGLDAPPADPVPGQCWIVGPAPSGAWTGHAHALAGWTVAGWRFAIPTIGMAVWIGGADGFVRWDGSGWVSGVLVGAAVRLGGEQVVGTRAAAIADPEGGATVDSEARAGIGQILTALRGHGLIAA